MIDAQGLESASRVAGLRSRLLAALEGGVEDGLDLAHPHHDHALLPGRAIVGIRIAVGHHDPVFELVDQDSPRRGLVELKPERPEEVLMPIGESRPYALVSGMCGWPPLLLEELLKLIYQRLALEVLYLGLQLVERPLKAHHEAIRHLGHTDPATGLFIQICSERAQQPLVGGFPALFSACHHCFRGPPQSKTS